jgi:SAM-dependent methyltransferase
MSRSAAAAARCMPASRPSAAPAPGDRVLDIGCGSGYLARLLAAAVAPGGQVADVDTSAPAISYARRRRGELLVRGGNGPEAPDESTAAHSTRHFLVGTATLLPGVRRFRANRACWSSARVADGEGPGHALLGVAGDGAHVVVGA